MNIYEEEKMAITYAIYAVKEKAERLFDEKDEDDSAEEELRKEAKIVEAERAEEILVNLLRRINSSKVNE